MRKFWRGFDGPHMESAMFGDVVVSDNQILRSSRDIVVMSCLIFLTKGSEAMDISMYCFVMECIKTPSWQTRSRDLCLERCNAKARYAMKTGKKE